MHFGRGKSRDVLSRVGQHGATRVSRNACRSASVALTH